MSCNCDNLKLGNTGLPNCLLIPQVVKKLIFVPYFQEDGDYNEITLASADIDDTFVLAKINNANFDERWVFSGEFKNIEQTQEDAIFESFNDGTRQLIQNGKRMFSGLLINTPLELLKKYREIGCHAVGVYFVDKAGNLIGSNTNALTLRPIKIDLATFYATTVLATDTTGAKTMVSFDFDRLDNDADWRMISADDDGLEANLLSYNGLIDVYSTVSAISQTGFTVKLTTSYGSANNNTVVPKLLITDFALYNVTDTAAVTISTMTESPDGTYAFTFASQDVADVLRMTPTKNGFDFEQVVLTTITVVS